MKELSLELEILGHYYDSEVIVTYASIDIFIYEFIHKLTGKKYRYKLSMIDLNNFGPGMVNMIKELKMEIREEKLNDLGI